MPDLQSETSLDETGPTPAAEHPGFVEATRVWLRIGMLSFGGPAGQIALMHRMLVEEREWVDEDRFLHGLNFCMLLPGPEAQQLATYIGWRLHGVWGGVVAGLLFILPGALLMFALSVAYFLFSDLALVQGLFLGVKAAIIAVVLEALHRISKRALKSNAAWVLAAGAFAAIFVFAIPFPQVVIGAGVIGLVSSLLGKDWFVPAGSNSKTPHLAPGAGSQVNMKGAMTAAAACLALWLLPVAALQLWLGPQDHFAQQSVFFSQMAVVTFGGAYAVLAYVAQQAVESNHWLSPGQMVDGLGLAETTPGPLVLVLQFVGFLAAAQSVSGLHPVLAGAIGSLIVLWVTFTPCFLWIFLGGPFIDRLQKVTALRAGLSAITAAVVGVVLNLALWFCLHVLFFRLNVWKGGPFQLLVPDIASIQLGALTIGIGAAIALLRFKLPLVPILLCSAAAGAVLHVAT